jgi:hypothetical protein
MTSATPRVIALMPMLSSAAYVAGSVLGVGAHVFVGTEELMP